MRISVCRVVFLCYWWISYYEHKCGLNYLNSEFGALCALRFSDLVQYRMDMHLFKKKESSKSNRNTRTFPQLKFPHLKNHRNNMQRNSCLSAAGIGLTLTFIIVPPRIDKPGSSKHAWIFTNRKEIRKYLKYISFFDIYLILYCSSTVKGCTMNVNCAKR